METTCRRTKNCKESREIALCRPVQDQLTRTCGFGWRAKPTQCFRRRGLEEKSHGRMRVGESVVPQDQHPWLPNEEQHRTGGCMSDRSANVGQEGKSRCNRKCSYEKLFRTTVFAKSFVVRVTKNSTAMGATAMTPATTPDTRGPALYLPLSIGSSPFPQGSEHMRTCKQILS